MLVLDARLLFTDPVTKLTWLTFSRPRSTDTTHTIYYRGHWLRVTRSQKHDPYHGTSQALKISVVARNNVILKKLVLQAKREYEADMEHRGKALLSVQSLPCSTLYDLPSTYLPRRQSWNLEMERC